MNHDFVLKPREKLYTSYKNAKMYGFIDGYNRALYERAYREGYKFGLTKHLNKKKLKKMFKKMKRSSKNNYESLDNAVLDEDLLEKESIYSDQNEESNYENNLNNQPDISDELN